MGFEQDDARHWEAVEEATELMQEGRFIEALVSLRGVIMTDPKNPYAFHHLGACLFESSELDAARDAYRAALRISPNYLGSRVGLSHTLRLLGDTRGALAEAKEALRQFPRDPEAQHAAGLAHAARGERDAARRELKGFLDQKPELEAAEEVRQILEDLGLGDEGDPMDVN